MHVSGHAAIASAEACARARRCTTCAWHTAASRRDCAALARAAGVAGRATGRAPGNAAACATSRLPHSRSTLSASSCVSSASAAWRSAAASPRQRPWHAAQGCQCRSRARARASRKVDGPDVLQVPASAKASSLELLRRAAKGSGEGTQRVSACAALGDETRAHRAHARRHRQRADGDAEAARRGARHRRPNVRATQQVSRRRAQKDGAHASAASDVCSCCAATGLGARHCGQSPYERQSPYDDTSCFTTPTLNSLRLLIFSQVGSQARADFPAPERQSSSHPWNT